MLTHLSYWTDNGAAYWYRREPGLDLATTLEQKLAELDELGVPIGAVELDSWFYMHETTRPVTELGELADVPPTGMLEWQPRADVLPDGISSLRSRLGDRPLTLHSRHISTSSPYLTEGDWWTDRYAHPVDQQWFTRWFDDAARWGASCIEQDWINSYWFGVDALRARAGRAVDWLSTLNGLAAERDMALVLCMALPGDIMAAASLDRVVAIRTSNDYRYTGDRAILWRWYLSVNRLAAALDIPTFKDCFFTETDPGDSGFDGDPHAEAESVLAALSGGIVGIGDRIGHTDVGVVERLLDADGRIATSDRAVALTDQSLTDSGAVVSFADAWSGPVRYVLALHLADTEEPVAGTLDLGDEVVVYDWRSGSAGLRSSIDLELEHRGWALFVCAPLVEVDGKHQADLGDPTRYATASPGRRRKTLRWIEGTIETE